MIMRSKKLIFSDLQPWIQLFSTEPVVSEKHFLDEEIMLSRSDFPIKPAELVEKCKVGVKSQYITIYVNIITECCSPQIWC